MTAEQMLTTVMMLLSLVTFVAMLVSWAEMGHPRHAFRWSIAFGVSAVQWGLLALRTWILPDRIVFPVQVGLSVAFTVLIFSGFRARAKLNEHLKPLLGFALTMAGIAVVLDRLGLRSIGWALPQLIRAVLVPMAAFYVLRRGETSKSERFTAAALGFWAVVCLVMATCMIASAGWNDPVSRILAGVAVPLSFTAVGLGTVLLLASDLAADLRRLAVKDALTNVLNRRGFDEAAANVVASECRRGESVCLVLADIDHFKSLNDRFGHLAGDRALIKVASCLAAEIRRGDVIGRIGGEEFAILLAPCKGPMARRIVERMRRSIEALDVGLPQGQMLTASFGVVELEPKAAFDRGMRRADEALYASKQAGRNRVTLAA